MKKQNLLLSIASLVALSLAALPTQAASVNGILSGEVTDPSGSVVANAKVVISHGNFRQTVLTNESGQYQVSNLAPGKYEVAVSSEGFGIFDRANLAIVAGHQTKMDAPLELATMVQTVTVSADPTR